MRKQRYRRYPSECGCGVEACLEVIGGKWKGLLLHQLIQHGTQRFGELIRLKPNLSARILSVQLQELEEDGIVSRKAFAVVPPKVEYSLTDYGRTLAPLIEHLQAWGDRDRLRREQIIAAHGIDQDAALPFIGRVSIDREIDSSCR